MIAVIIITFCGSRKAYRRFYWLRKSRSSEWLHYCDNLLVTLSSNTVSLANPKGTGSWASLAGPSEWHIEPSRTEVFGAARNAAS